MREANNFDFVTVCSKMQAEPNGIVAIPITCEFNHEIRCKCCTSHIIKFVHFLGNGSQYERWFANLFGHFNEFQEYQSYAWLPTSTFLRTGIDSKRAKVRRKFTVQRGNIECFVTNFDWSANSSLERFARKFVRLESHQIIWSIQQRTQRILCKVFYSGAKYIKCGSECFVRASKRR